MNADLDDPAADDVGDDDTSMALPSPLPLFPLRTVLFPGGLLGLKVFEARYLDMVSRCLREQSPFGVVCLRQGSEARSGAPVQLETVGVLARIEEVDSEQAGILSLRCVGSRRFRLSGPAVQAPDGLWQAPAEALPDDEPEAPAAALKPTVEALVQAIANLAAQDVKPFVEPYRFEDAGWVANRWCEILPISLAAKQKLMELDDAGTRLKLVDEYLRSKGVLR